MADYAFYEGYPSALYIGTPVCWDGGNLNLFVSYSNNARYGVAATYLGTAPVMAGNFTDTTTSDAPYTYNTEFVRPGLVPLITSWDQDLTVYPPVTPNIVVVVSVTADGITEVSRQPYPSMTYSVSGFLRQWVMWPDEPTFFMYGNQGTSYVEGWQATVGTDGTLSAITSIGTTTTWPKASGNFYYGATPRAVTDRWALGSTVSTYCFLYDRLNPLATTNVFTALPGMTNGDSPNSQTLMSDARAAPGHVLSTRGPYVNPIYRNHVLDLVLSDDGSTFTTVGDWTAPDGTAWTATGWSSEGKAVAYCQGTDGSKTGFYDIFGADTEFEVGTVSVQNNWVVPTAPAQPNPPFNGALVDAWISAGYVTPYEVGMFTGPIATISSEMGPERTRFS